MITTNQLAVTLALLAAGGAKLAGAAAMVELFDKIGVGQCFRYFTGMLEAAAGIGWLISRCPFSAVVPLTVVMVGAFIAPVTVLGSSLPPRSCCSSSPERSSINDALDITPN